MSELCDDCGRSYDIIYRVPDEVWAKIAPKPIEGFEEGGLLCPDCASLRAWDHHEIVLRFDGTQGWWSDTRPTTSRNEGVEEADREVLVAIDASGSVRALAGLDTPWSPDELIDLLTEWRDADPNRQISMMPFKEAKSGFRLKSRGDNG